MWPRIAENISRLTLVSSMACRLYGAMPSPKPMPIYCKLEENTLFIFEWNILLFIQDNLFQHVIFKSRRLPCGILQHVFLAKHQWVNILQSHLTRVHYHFSELTALMPNSIDLSSLLFQDLATLSSYCVGYLKFNNTWITRQWLHG